MAFHIYHMKRISLPLACPPVAHCTSFIMLYFFVCVWKKFSPLDSKLCEDSNHVCLNIASAASNAVARIVSTQ